MKLALPNWQWMLLRHPGYIVAFALLLLAAAGLLRFRYGRGEWGPLVILAACLLLGHRGWARFRRERIIREAPLPVFLRRKLREAYPNLGQKDIELVERGLRQFFLACHRSRHAFVAMPSRVVDAMWHEFILHTQAYRDWCALALGRFLHHTPAEVLGNSAQHNDGLRRAWFWACRDEAIDPRAPTRLPLLFALDGKLEIADGFRYMPVCGPAGVRRGYSEAGAGGWAYCATSFSDEGGGSGDAAGFGGCDPPGDGDGGSGGDGGGGDGGGDAGGGGCGGGGGD